MPCRLSHLSKKGVQSSLQVAMNSPVLQAVIEVDEDQYIVVVSAHQRLRHLLSLHLLLFKGPRDLNSHISTNLLALH